MIYESYTHFVKKILVEKYYDFSSILDFKKVLPEVHITLDFKTIHLPRLYKGIHTVEHGIKYYRTKKLFNTYNLSSLNIKIYRKLMNLKYIINKKEVQNKEALEERIEFRKLISSISKIENDKLFKIEEVLDKKIFEETQIKDIKNIENSLRNKYVSEHYWIDKNVFNLKTFINKNTQKHFIGLKLFNQKGYIDITILSYGMSYNKNLYNFLLKE